MLVRPTLERLAQVFPAVMSAVSAVVRPVVGEGPVNVALGARERGVREDRIDSDRNSSSSHLHRRPRDFQAGKKY
jgi:hypothetical protein